MQGKYPVTLIDLWNKYDEEKESENDSPEIFEDNQIFIVLELEYCGKDLESFVFSNAEQSYSALMQVGSFTIFTTTTTLICAIENNIRLF